MRLKLHGVLDADERSANFQYQKGAIKTRFSEALEYRGRYPFNTKKVRLKHDGATYVIPTNETFNTKKVRLKLERAAAEMLDSLLSIPKRCD